MYKFRISNKLFLIGLIAVLAFLIFAVIAINEAFRAPTEAARVGWAISIFVPVAAFAVAFIFRLRLFGIVEVDTHGVTRKCFMMEDFRLEYKDCKGIGLGYHFIGLRSKAYWVYFSKKEISDQSRVDFTQIPFDGDVIRIAYSDELIEVLEQCVSAETIESIKRDYRKAQMTKVTPR